MKPTKLLLLLAAVLIALAPSCKKDELQVDKDKSVIKKYLKENNITAECVSNVHYVENVVGNGPQCKLGDTVAVKFTVKSIKDPTKIIEDNSHIAEIFILPESRNTKSDVLFGLQIALPTMKEGGKTTFYIPSAYAYGSTPVNGETNANLIYDVELCEIIHRGNVH